MNKTVIDLASKWKIVVAALVFLCLFAVPFAGGGATAEAQTILKVVPGQVTDCTLPVTVSIEGLPQGQAVNGLNLKVAYDPALLQYQSNQTGSFAAGWTWFTPTINNTEGTIEFSSGNFSGNNPPSSGTVLTITFQVVGNGTAQFTLPKLNLRDSNNTNIALTPQIGQAVLSGCGPTISVVPGQVTDCTLPVTVSIEGLSQGQAVNGLNLKVAYDPALLQYQSNQTGSFAAGWTWFTPTINNTEGTIEFSSGNFSGNNPPSSGTVLTITFQVVGNGTAQFTLPKLNLRDSNNTNIALTPQIGQAVLSGCPAEQPAVSTADATEIGTGEAVLNGSVTGNGGGEITEYGFYWGTTDNPASKVKVGSTDFTGSYSFVLGELDEETTYYFKAYAVNSAGTGYGEVKSFTTGKEAPVVVEPVVETADATEIVTGSAVLNGSVTDNGNGEITEYGFYWGTSEEPGTKVIAGESDLSGAYAYTLGELDEETTYYFKAYAVNSAGTGHGEVKSFTTDKDTPVVVEPVVETADATEVGTGSAVLNGSITDNGNGEITEYGFYWGTSEEPGTKVIAGESDLSGAYAYDLSGLDEETTYYFKAYAVNSAGTGFGEVKSFTTDKDTPVVVEPVVETADATEIGTGSAVLNGSVTDNGNGEITEYGFYWGTSEDPGTKVIAGESDLSGAYAYDLSGLDEETTYYFKAYAVNSAGTGFGEVKSFTTKKTGGTDPPELEVTVELSRTEDVNFARPLGLEGAANESVDWQIIVKDSAGAVMDTFSPAAGTSFSVEYRPEQMDLPYSAEYTVEVTATPAEGDPVTMAKTFGVSNYSFKTAELVVSASAGSLSVSAQVENLEAQAKQVQGILQVTNSAGDVVDLHIGEPVTINSMGSEVLQFSCSDIETPGEYQAQLFLWLQTEEGWIILGDSVVTSFTI
jgi:hypothetical protein